MPNSSSVVELSPHYFKIKGSCQAAAARSEADNGEDINENAQW